MLIVTTPNYRGRMEWTAADAAAWIAVPGADDDKYSRGVLGLVTGSERYPGAAVLGAEAALHTGVGMLRYLGGARDAVLARRPEAVTAEGRVQAWVLGSGVDPDNRAVGAEGVPAVLDAGALGLVGEARGPVILTPHAGELARLVSVDRAEVAADPAGAAARAADRFGATVLLKGSTTYVRGPGIELEARTAPPWLATAGAGDALGGILGALLATHEIFEPGDLGHLAATAAVIHGLAAQRASNGGPFTVLQLCHALPATIADLLASR
jgi:hydroxyethylthiazole kinase-like uncharacterized protein yjeF